jgi:hypothetical protein|tara:strand:+ start:5346 stop:5801 length:456 start_codon:yes stop_codon:yes gene_type:complete
MHKQVISFNHETYKMPNLNQLFGQHHYARNKIKQGVQLALTTLFKRSLQPIEYYPLQIWFQWQNRTRRIDPDNQASAGQKIILDALQQAKIIDNDGTYNVAELHHQFNFGVDAPSLEITLIEADPDTRFEIPKPRPKSVSTKRKKRQLDLF